MGGRRSILLHGYPAFGRAPMSLQKHCVRGGFQTCCHLPLVSREWKNGRNSSYNYSCTPFLHSLLTKGKVTGVCVTVGFGTRLV